MSKISRRANEFAKASNLTDANHRDTLLTAGWKAGYMAAIEDAANVADETAQAAFEQWKDDAAGIYAANRLRRVGWDSAAAIRNLSEA